MIYKLQILTLNTRKRYDLIQNIDDHENTTTKQDSSCKNHHNS